jgi:cytochrome b561
MAANRVQTYPMPMKVLHWLMAVVIIAALVVVHVAAELRHGFIDKDSVLGRMLFARAERS